MVATNATAEVCPHDEGAMQFCDPQLCRQQVCFGHPRAQCRVNPCGGCSTDFFDSDNQKVDCNEGKKKPARNKNVVFFQRCLVDWLIFSFQAYRNARWNFRRQSTRRAGRNCTFLRRCSRLAPSPAQMTLVSFVPCETLEINFEQNYLPRTKFQDFYEKFIIPMEYWTNWTKKIQKKCMYWSVLDQKIQKKCLYWTNWVKKSRKNAFTGPIGPKNPE